MERLTPRRTHAWILLGLGIVVFFWRLGDHDLWPSDEPRFGMQAWEMRTSGDYVVPTLNGRPNTEKPPLLFWAINAFVPLTGGVNEWSARLPSAVSTVLILFLIHLLGTWLYDRETGLYGALVFATTAQILVRGRWASTDLTLNFFVLAAIVLLWGAATRAEARGWWAPCAWACMGLATLAKGPVGAVLPLMAIGPVLVLERDWRGVRRLFPVTGLALYAVVTGSWYASLAGRLGLGEVLAALHRNNVLRYLEATNFRHSTWYYLGLFPAAFIPWTFFLPAAFRDAFRDRDEAGRRRSATFLVSWFAVMFVFFSIASGKRGVYIIPLYPAAALLIGALLARGARSASPDGPWRKRLLLPVAMWTGLAGALMVLLPMRARDRYPELLAAAVIAAVILLAGALAAAMLQWRGRAGPAAASLVVSMALLSLFANETIVPWINAYQNVRGFAERVRGHLSPEVTLATGVEKRSSWVFYLGRTVEEVGTSQEILDYLAGPGPRDLIIGGPEIAAIRDRIPPEVTTVVEDKVGSWDFYLLRKPPPVDAREGS